MGQINRQGGALAGAVLLALALTACSGPSNPAQSASASAGAASTSPDASPDASSSPATDPPTPTGDGSVAASAPGSDGLGGFGSVAEACAAVSATALSMLALPMAAATGKDTAEVEKARTELEKIKGQVPAELKEPFERLKSIADDADQDLSKFSRSEFDKAIAPIDGWLQAHC
jgi:hypothetical protein